MITISIIIPTYNEAENIGKLVKYLIENCDNSVVDLIVADGGSTDNTLEIAKQSGAKAMVSPVAGRAVQMNYAAEIAKGDVLYFIHADCYPPKSFVNDIQMAIKNGYDLGRYCSQFDSNKLIIKINAWFTRFDMFICMGGDQTLFIKNDLFTKCNGFNRSMKIMEEYEFCERARKTGRYKILKGKALISARKYNTNSWLKVQLANYKVVNMYKKGATQQQLLDTYKRMLSYRKNAI